MVYILRVFRSLAKLKVLVLVEVSAELTAKQPSDLTIIPKGKISVADTDPSGFELITLI